MTYDIEGNYGYEWEYLIGEDNLADAKLRKQEYDENEPQYPHRIVKNYP
jgi:hypothetical protein